MGIIDNNIIMNLNSRKNLGLLFVGAGIALILVSIIIRVATMFDNFIGFYLGPVAVFIGVGLLIVHKE